jgi:hypothetical protein
MISPVQKHTLCQVAKAETKAQTWQRVCFYQHNKKFIFYSNLGCLIFLPTHNPLQTSILKVCSSTIKLYNITGTTERHLLTAVCRNGG